MKKWELGKSSKCIICGSSRLKRYKTLISSFLIERAFGNKKQKTDLLLCENCSIRFFELRPNEEQMSELYKDYRGEEYQKQREKHESFYTPELNYLLGHNPQAVKNRKEVLSNVLKKNVDISTIKTVLDYGGDQGQFIPDDLNAEKFVYEVSNIEPLNGITSIANKEELKNYKWDLIMCCHVLEHVSYPVELLNEILSLLSQGGLLYIELPNEPMIKSPRRKKSKLGRIIKRIIGDRVGKFRFILKKYAEEGNVFVYPIMNEHINFFEIKTFEHIFNSSKYQILNTHARVDSTFISILVKKM